MRNAGRGQWTEDWTCPPMSNERKRWLMLAVGLLAMTAGSTFAP